jgi:hypothetical protein
VGAGRGFAFLIKQCMNFGMLTEDGNAEVHDGGMPVGGEEVVDWRSRNRCEESGGLALEG